jgi:hypothetical protein
MRSKIVSLTFPPAFVRRATQDNRPTRRSLRSRSLRPERADIAAPELPQRLRWLGGEPPRLAELLAAGPVLVHFFDFAQLNSVRALPYVIAWRERYADAGLVVLGAHSPRFPFTAERDKLAAGLERLGVEHPVADDSNYELWHDYGCRGWPSLFLWGQGGALRWFHFGEGEYAATEAAIQDELRALDPEVELPDVLEPLRPSDAPEALVAPPTEEVFPGGSPSQPWTAIGGEETLELAYAAGGAFASVDGAGKLRFVVDDGSERALAIDAPGLYELAAHPAHESHRLRLGTDGELAIYSLSFAAAATASASR